MKALRDPFLWIGGLIVAGLAAFVLIGDVPGQGEGGEVRGVMVLDPEDVIEVMRETADDPDDVSPDDVVRKLRAIAQSLADEGYVVIDGGGVFAMPEAARVDVQP